MKINSRFLIALMVVAMITPLLTGCFLWDQVDSNEVGVIADGGRLERCVPPGVYSDARLFADLKKVSASTVTFSVEDPEVVTKDNQLISLAITIQARRKPDCESVMQLLTNWSAMIDDQHLVSIISATAREGIKIGTRAFNLTELLDDRNGLSTNIMNALYLDASKYSVDIINVTIENIGLDPRYGEQLQEKALLTAKIETELRRQDLIRQEAANRQLEQEQRNAVLLAQLDAEQAQTNVQVEIASREGKEIAARNEVYLTNDPAYELERLRLIQGILSNKSVVYFVPSGSDLSLLFTQQPVLPIPATLGPDVE
jgi:uncharacterized membrane protein YqiK